MEKIKGQVYMYDPNSKSMKEMEIEASVQVNWGKICLDENKRTFHAYPRGLAKCPYDEEELRFDIIFADDFPTKTSCAGRCIHFSPSDFLTNREIASMLSEIDKIENGYIYVKETKKEFADKMGWEVQWCGGPHNEYYVFIQKKAE